MGPKSNRKKVTAEPPPLSEEELRQREKKLAVVLKDFEKQAQVKRNVLQRSADDLIKKVSLLYDDQLFKIPKNIRQMKFSDFFASVVDAETEENTAELAVVEEDDVDDRIYELGELPTRTESKKATTAKKPKQGTAVRKNTAMKAPPSSSYQTRANRFRTPLVTKGAELAAPTPDTVARQPKINEPHFSKRGTLFLTNPRQVCTAMKAETALLLKGKAIDLAGSPSTVDNLDSSMLEELDKLQKKIAMVIEKKKGKDANNDGPGTSTH